MNSSSGLPCLDEVRGDLGVEPVNTGRTMFALGPSGIVTDDMEALHAVTDEQERVVLRSGVEFPPAMYRGQPQEYSPCVPTLGRQRTPAEQLLALCRTVAFEGALGGHPVVRVAERALVLGRPLRVDRTALAQHYGLCTDLLDFTANFDVASFFAVCRWDEATGTYVPIGPSPNPGVIYRTPPWAIMADVAPGFDFQPVGWQPLPRPEQQRAFGLRLTRGQDLTSVQGLQVVRFRQCLEISTEVWNAFDQGQALFPNDSAGSLAMEAGSLTCFSREQVDRAWHRLDAWHGGMTSGGHRRQVEREARISLTHAVAVKWEALDENEEVVARQVSTMLDRIRFRRVLYVNEPDK